MNQRTPWGQGGAPHLDRFSPAPLLRASTIACRAARFRASAATREPLSDAHTPLSDAHTRASQRGGSASNRRPVRRQESAQSKQTSASNADTSLDHRYLSRNSPHSSIPKHRRSVEHGERACSTARQSECGLVSIWSVLTSGGAIWSRSTDGPSWSFEGQHEKHGWGAFSPRGQR